MSGLSKRHGLIWPSAQGWDDVRVSTDPAHHAILQRWQQQDWPLVLRRRDPDCPVDEICIGLALPPDQDGVKLRVALRMPQAGVRSARAPLDITEVIAHAPAAWQAPLRKLHDDASGQALSLCIYGSLAWQALTGQSYVRPASDIDVLFIPRDGDQLQRGVQLLTQHAAWLPLDGEIAFPGGAVSWKEWAQATVSGNRVLAKRAGDVALLCAGDLRAALEDNTCGA